MGGGLLRDNRTLAPLVLGSKSPSSPSGPVASIFLKTTATPTILWTLLSLEKLSSSFWTKMVICRNFIPRSPLPLPSHFTPPSQAPRPLPLVFSLPSFQQTLSLASGSCNNPKGLDHMPRWESQVCSVHACVCICVGRGRCMCVCVCVGVYGG